MTLGPVTGQSRGVAMRRSSAVARSLALGFAGAVAMWVVAYVAMMRPGMLVGEALFALTLACAGVAGHVAGRGRLPLERGWVAGAKAGLVIATLNMLLIGSLVGGESRGERLLQLLLWTASNYAITLALAAIGGALGGRIASASAAGQSRNWFSLFTRVAAVTVFLLLITGGLVTGLEAGLAVPDWPNSFGHNMLLYPLSQMVGGVYYEHAHRLYGMLVGVTAITLAVNALFFDERKWLRALTIAYLLMVCVQGYMGGTRVTETSVPLAIMHGVFGQIVFATVCAIAAFTSPRWIDDHLPAIRPGAGTDRTWSLVLAVALALQLILGAVYRHTLHVHVLYTHILWAAFATGLIIFVGGRAWAKHADVPPLPRLGKAMLHTVGLQIVLGVVSMIAVWSRPSAPPTGSGEATPLGAIPLWEVVFTTLHQATGALLLAFAVMTMLWTRRMLAPSPSAVSHLSLNQS